MGLKHVNTKVSCLQSEAPVLWDREWVLTENNP